MTDEVGSALAPGVVARASLAPIRGREQGGRRPVIVVSSPGYLATVTALVVVVPVSTTARGWPNHVRLEGPTGLKVDSWAMTEQPRTLSRTRITDVAGRVDAGCLRQIRTWLADFLDFAP